MKNYLKKILLQLFKRKEYLSESQKENFYKCSFLDVYEEVLEEENRTRVIDAMLNDKLKVLELKE